MPARPTPRSILIAIALAALGGPGLAAQTSLGAQAIAVLGRADPVPGGGTLSEARLVQTGVMGGAALAGGRLRLHGMLNLEGATMPGGVLTPGGWGEGFVDRRHPHTYVHVLMASLVDAVRAPLGLRWSVSAGKGFAPYGTDDPMTRGAVAFPVDHHWSQLPERLVLIGAVRAGPLTIEAGLFNGDEPEHPAQWPKFDRFGDSWSARALLAPVPGLEVQVSRARVASPEHRLGAGLQHDLWSVSGRLERAVGPGRLTALVEWARADEEGAYLFHAVLAEAEFAAGPWRPYARFERTTRPEESRLFGDDFRTIRPHNENANLGTTRWTIATMGVGRRFGPPRWPVRLEAIGEGAVGRVAALTGIFDPAAFYGGNELWMASVGVRITAGGSMHRMGRYGLIAPAGGPGDHHGPP